MTATLEETKAELAATQRELDLLGEYFLLALAKLPKSTLTVTLTDQARLGKLPLALQAKNDKHGAVHFRAVEAK